MSFVSREEESGWGWDVSTNWLFAELTFPTPSGLSDKLSPTPSIFKEMGLGGKLGSNSS